MVGYALSTKDGVAATKAGAVTTLEHDAERVAVEADYLVLAVPPRATVELLRRLAGTIRARGLYCTDVASVKAVVVRRAADLGLGDYFAGSHPLAGTHLTGFTASSEHQFDGAVVYVTPVPGHERAAAEAADFWQQAMGAHPVSIVPEQHDRLMATTSHLPQALSSALAVALARTAPGGVSVGAGARSVTRLAAGDPDLWVEILLANGDEVLASLAHLDEALEGLRSALEEKDPSALQAWLREGAAWRRRFEP